MQKDSNVSQELEASSGLPQHRWAVVAMLWSICFFNYADRQAIFSVFPLLARDLSLNNLQLGLLGSSFAWTYALSGPVAGVLVDRMQRRRAILFGLHTWSIICAATAFCRSFGSLLVFRGLEGLGESIYFPASMSMIATYHGPKTRSLAFGVHQTSIYAGTIAGGLFAGWIGQHYGWRWSFLVFGTLGIILGIFLQHRLKEPPRDQPMSERASFAGLLRFGKELLHRPEALLLMFGFGASNFVAVVQLVWVPSLLYLHFGMSLAYAGFLATITAQSGAALGALAGGALADRMAKRFQGGRALIQMLALLSAAPFVLWCGVTHSRGSILIGLFLWGLCKGAYDANTFASLFDVLPPDMRGVSTGTMNSAGWLLGGTTAPVCIGWLAMHTSLPFAIALSSSVYLLAALLVGIALWRLRYHSRALLR